MSDKKDTRDQLEKDRAESGITTPAHVNRLKNLAALEMNSLLRRAYALQALLIDASKPESDAGVAYARIDDRLRQINSNPSTTFVEPIATIESINVDRLMREVERSVPFYEPSDDNFEQIVGAPKTL